MWTELIELVNQSRVRPTQQTGGAGRCAPGAVGTSVSGTSVGSGTSVSGGGGAESSKPREQTPPDPALTRHACQALANVVNRMPDDTLRRVFIVLTEELFNAIFRDYVFAYDPREDTLPSQAPPQAAAFQRAPPRLSEETLASAVPYSAVVQSLRDAAKDAIMRRLELEAKSSCMPLAVPEASVRARSRDTAALADAHDVNRSSFETFRAVEDVSQGYTSPVFMQIPGAADAQTMSRQVSFPTADEQKGLGPARSSTNGLCAREEVQLREELRHARLLADTYQARVLELERVRIELEEEVQRVRQERDRTDAVQQKLASEVRRLRAEADSTRAARVSLQAQQQHGLGGSGRSPRLSLGHGTSGGTSSRKTLQERRMGGSMADQKPFGTGARQPAVATTQDATSAEDGHGHAPAPSEEELPSSRLRRVYHDLHSRTLLRTPRDRGSGSVTHTSSGTSLLSAAREERLAMASGAADAAAGGGARLRRNYGPNASSATTLHVSVANVGGNVPGVARSVVT